MSLWHQISSSWLICQIATNIQRLLLYDCQWFIVFSSSYLSSSLSFSSHSMCDRLNIMSAALSSYVWERARAKSRIILWDLNRVLIRLHRLSFLSVYPPAATKKCVGTSSSTGREVPTGSRKLSISILYYQLGWMFFSFALSLIGANQTTIFVV